MTALRHILSLILLCVTAALPAVAEPGQDPGSEPMVHLFDLELKFRPDAQPVVPTEGRDPLQGNGDGTFHGPRLSGKLRWSNFEKVGGELCQINLVAVLEPESGGRILVDSQGYALLADPENPTRWQVSAALRFETEAPEHEWLTSTLGVWQGTFDAATGQATYRAYVPASAVVAAPAENKASAASTSCAAGSE